MFEQFINMLKSTACQTYGRHCSDNGEQNHNVFFRPSNTLPVCATDSNGDFGSSIENGIPHIVEFEYQVQTTLSQTVGKLNTVTLRDIERSISDTVVEGLFAGMQCTVPAVVKSGSTETAEDDGDGDGAPSLRHRSQRNLRYLQQQPEEQSRYYYSDQLSGLSAEPQDMVLPGSAGGAYSLLCCIIYYCCCVLHVVS